MRKFVLLIAGFCALATTLAVPQVATAQVQGLYFQEVEKDGRVYVFNTPETFKMWQESGDMGKSVTLIGQAEGGKTLVGENETAVDLYMFRHNLPSYDRPTPKPVVPPTYPKTTIGGRFFGDITSKEIKDKATGVKSADSGVGIDVKRFYFTLTHEFDAMWSAQFQSDIGDVGARRYDVFVKKAFLQAKINPSAIFRLGSADTAWVPFAESMYGMRYFEQTLSDSLGFGTSADWGLHFLGKAVSDKLGYQLSLQNGQTYSRPVRSKTVDFEGRVSYEPIKGLTFGVGTYSGKRGLETDAAPAKHTASRVNFLANYVVGKFKIGGEHFTADNWTTVTSTSKDKAEGTTVWTSYGFTDKLSLFGRYDTAKPSKDLKPKLELTYYNIGLQWKPMKALTTALAYKFADVKGGTISTGNGTIGTAAAGKKGEYSEIGIWAQYDF